MNLLENLGEAIQKTIEEKCKDLENPKIKNSNLSSNEIKAAKRLGAIEDFTVDRIEEGIAVLENRETKKIENVEKEKLPQEIKEGDILKKINGKYFIDETQTNEVENRIKDKMNKLWK